MALAAVKMGLFKSRTSRAAYRGRRQWPRRNGIGQRRPVEPAGNGAFPRRMLAISIHSYLYANPLHNGDSGFAMDDAKRTGTDAAVRRLAERSRVPKEQLYHLTDARLLGENDRKAAKKGDAKTDPPKRLSKVMPLKMVVEGTIAKFLETSRAQDHIVIMFCGHVIDKKGEVYLVPIDGDFDEIDSLIPLKWFYDKLAACPAQEKVVIYDVCRFHPERGIERPYPGPMTEAMENALHASPDDVTVITSCSKGEQSIELDYYNTQLSFDTPGIKGTGVDLHGSFFLSLFHAASIAGALSPEKKLPDPGDELPVERMTKWMKEKLAEVVHHRFIDRTQTLKATIKRRAEPIAYNPAEPVPPHFDFPAPPPSADPKAVMQIVSEIQLPPIKSLRADAPPPSISDVLPFSQEALKPYMTGELKPGDKPNEFQQAVLDAIEEMRRLSGAGSGAELPEEFGGDTSDAAKAQLRRIQEIPARVEAILQDSLDNLDSVVEQKEKQSKRWKVNYDYIVAQVKLRICYVNQYNMALGNVRIGKLPDLKEGQNGYRLTAGTTLDRNTSPDKKDLFSEARKALTRIAKDNPKTPWAFFAKSDRTVAIGLRLTGSSVAGGLK